MVFRGPDGGLTLHIDTYLSVLTLNCNGLREPGKRNVIARLLYIKVAGLCILTETHLRPREVEGLAIPNHHVVAGSCRDPIRRIGGEVSILARHSLNEEPHASRSGVPNAAEICPVKIYPTTSSDAGLLVTGMDIPPESTNIPDTEILAESRREPINERTQC